MCVNWLIWENAPWPTNSKAVFIWKRARACNETPNCITLSPKRELKKRMPYIYFRKQVCHAFTNWMMRPTKRNPCAPQTPSPSLIFNSKTKTISSKPAITCGSVVVPCFRKQIAISRKYFTNALDTESLVLFARQIRFGRSTSVNEIEGSPLSQNACQGQAGALFQIIVFLQSAWARKISFLR